MQPHTRIAFLLMIVAGLTLAVAARAELPKVGEKAPSFEGADQDGKPWKASDIIGKKLLLLYFYPEDDTPGRATEACGLRDRMGNLRKDNVEVVGVSFDSAESQKRSSPNTI